MSWKQPIKKELIGKGTFGEVFKVTNQAGEIGALKVINREFHNFCFLFRSAFETAKKIDDINCCKMYEWISDDEVSWVMEYIEGKAISSLKFIDIQSLDNILKIMIQVCNGLIALHSRNIIHRDLKPENILINSDGVIKITDFDFIKSGFSEKQKGQFLGTPEYSSPEHFIASYKLDTRSDLYALGVILYELLTGILPFSGKTAKEIGDQHRLKPLILPTKINPEIPQNVENIIIGLLEKDANDRYQNAHSIAGDLLKEIKDKKGIKLKSDVSYLLKPKFVNRTTPLKALNNLSDQLKDKNGNIVLIHGESGIGKSKLVQQFYYHLQLAEIEFYQSICKTVESSFNPLHKIFEEIISNKSETEKQKYFGEFGWDLVKYGILSEQDWMKKIKKPIELSGQNAEFRLFGAITDFLKKAASKPLVICIDDLHWADEQILKWLQYAERNLKGFPVLFIGLHRSEMLFEDSALFKIENLIQIKVKNLKEIDVSEMIKSMLGKKRKNREMNNFIENIVSHTNGNPLFIREMLYFLNEKGKISISDNKWNFPPKIEIETLPENIQNVISERLEELSFESLRTLQIAAIIGKKFSFEMLLHLTKKKENELLEDLIDCREVSLLEESGNDFVFIHDKIREVLESEMMGKNFIFWKELHQRAGEYLEEKYSSNPDEVLDELADHFYKAEHSEKSIKYLELVGDRARKNFQNDKSLDYYEKLLKDLHTQSKRINEKDKNYDQLQKRINKVHNNKGISYRQIGRIKEAQSEFTSAFKIAKRIRDKVGIQQANHEIGWCYYWKGDNNNALQYFEKGMKLAEELNQKKESAYAFASIGNIYGKRGDYGNDLVYQKRSLKICQEIDDPWGISGAYSNIGVAYLHLGEHEKSIRYLKKSVKVAEEFDFKWQVSTSLVNMGYTFCDKGDFDKSIQHYKKSIKIAEDIGAKRLISILFTNIGYTYILKREYDKAIECYDKAIVLKKELDMHTSLLDALNSKADILCKLQKYREAKKINEDALELAKKIKNKDGEYDYKVLNAKISFHLSKKEKLKIEKGIIPLEKLLKQEKDESRIAELSYETWKMKKELASEIVENTEKNRKTALRLYRKFYKKKPGIYYKLKIEELEKI
ncbi:MAG TPA: tetratricopeptide repeat protein [Candidatus Cloacimonetes bacterium]|nr:tetratricopeptide repeat protein [Candidatus Cloacimonadota bacterium]